MEKEQRGILKTIEEGRRAGDSPVAERGPSATGEVLDEADEDAHEETDDGKLPIQDLV